MKNRVGNKIIYYLTLVFIPGFLWAQPPDGWWKHDQTNLLLQVETTADGIKTKRYDQDVWYTYHEFRDDQFRDQKGNTYYLMGNQDLEWEDDRGSKRIRFHRTNAPEGYNDRHDDYRTQNDYAYGNSGTRYDAINPRKLEGRWVNRSTGQKIVVNAKRNRIKVKAHRGGWATFERNNRRGWTDHRGNQYVFRNGNLIYTSRNGDFMMRFVKRS